MKHKLLFLRFFVSLLLLAVSTISWAYDFYMGGIYYNQNSDGTSVTVTYKNESNRGYSGSVVIPSSVTYDGKTYDVASIGKYAFSHCSGLTSVTIPNSVTSIDVMAFASCLGLTSVSIPNSVTSICSYAFQGCSGLISVTIGNGVTSIGYEAFYGCSGLTTITIPKSVTSIGIWAFYGCSGLTSVTCLADEVPCTGIDIFKGVCQDIATLYVPASSIDAYKNADQWKDFAKILPIEEKE